MILKDLFFFIHYCKCRQENGPERDRRGMSRTLQHHELLLITGGKGSLIIDKKRYPLSGGTLIYLWPNVLHTIEIDVREPLKFLSIHFSCVPISFTDGRWAVLDEVKRLPLQAVQELKDYYQVEDVCKKLVASWNAKLPGYEFIARTLLQQLFLAISQNMKKQHQNYSLSVKVERVIEYMHQNMNQRVTLAELAETVQLAPTYLSRAFKSTTGYSVIEYFNRIKVDKAKELLSEGNKKVKEVAQTLGFTDEFYFSRLFKGMEGISPSEYQGKNVHGI